MAGARHCLEIFLHAGLRAGAIGGSERHLHASRRRLRVRAGVYLVQLSDRFAKWTYLHFLKEVLSLVLYAWGKVCHYPSYTEAIEQRCH